MRALGVFWTGDCVKMRKGMDGAMFGRYHINTCIRNGDTLVAWEVFHWLKSYFDFINDYARKSSMNVVQWRLGIK